MHLTPYDSVFSLIILLLAYFVATLTARFLPMPGEHGRYGGIDGIRGLLALAVFIHHGAVWYGYLRSGVWQAPPANLYSHLGSSAVLVFFMITAFLFGSKVFKSSRGSIDWIKLAVGRFLRLLPLYWVMLCLLLVVVFANTDFRFKEGERFVSAVARWATLTIFGAPDVNGWKDTFIVVAGVTWTLPFEVTFYCLLPWVALLARRDFSAAPLLIGSSAMFVLLGSLFTLPHPILLAAGMAFGIGIVAASLLQSDTWRHFAHSRIAAGIAIVSPVLAILWIDDGMRLRSVALFGILFLIVSGGSDLFGLLRTRGARFLGEISFGIYLLHGIVLFIVFTDLLGYGRSSALTPLQHWSIVAMCAPIVILLATLGHYLIEKPALRLVDKSVEAIRILRFRLLTVRRHSQ